VVCKQSPPATIPANKIWDTNACKLTCKDPQPSVIPSTKYWSEDSCSLKCKQSSPVPTPVNFKWDANTCSLVCENDLSGVPKAGFTWNANTCSYVANACTLKDSDCKAPQKVNGNCQCECPINMREPQYYNSAIKVWDSATCALKCKVDKSGTPKDGFTWNADICDYDCTRQCTDNYVLDKASCKCACGITNANCTTPQTVNSACECGCPADKQKPANINLNIHTWDSIACELKCIDAVPNPLTSGKRWDTSTCTQVCEKVLQCPGNQRFSADTCECRCDPSKPADLPTYKLWDNVKCAAYCSATKPASCPYDGQTWDENLCKCNCANEATTTCAVGSFFSPKLGCRCVPPCETPPPASGCEADMHWCQETCQCECKDEFIPYGYQCQEDFHYFDNSTCFCECKNVFDCAQPDLFYFEQETCACECQTGEPPEGCASVNPLYAWYPEFCDCKCANFNTDRIECTKQTNKKWDSNKCSCGCKTAPVCNAAIHNVNLDTCSCDCKSGVQPCETDKGFAWSRLQCQCVFCDSCRSSGITVIN
jgi:hypothetical protein